MSHPSDCHPGTDPRIDAYVRLIRVADQLFSTVSRELVAHGITATQFSALKALCLKGPLSQKELAASILKSAGNLTLVVDNLEKQGLAVRTKSSGDRRSIQIEVTPKGRAYFDEIYEPHLHRIRQAMSALDPKSCDLMCELLERLAVPATSGS